MNMTDPRQMMAQELSAQQNGSESVQVDPKQVQKFLAWGEKQFEICKKSREPFERQWYLNLAFYFGRQYVQWLPQTNTNGARLYEPSAPKWRVRLISNKIKPIVRNELAKITKEQPQSYVAPASSDDSDLFAAQAADSISEYEMDILHYNRILRRAGFWMLLCGSAFIKDWWDDSKPDPTGAPGSICLEPVNAFHMYCPEVQEEELENQPYLFHSMAKTPEWIHAQYGIEVKPDTNVSASLLEQRFLSAIGASTEQTGRFTMVKEQWIKPCSMFPDGAVMTWAGSTMLSFVPYWPFSHNEFPFAKLDHIPTGRFWGDSIINDLIPLQREYNRTRSQIIEAKNRMSKPQLVAPKGSVDPNKITSEPGLIIFYTPGFAKPEPLQLQPIPSYVVQELDRIQKDMDDISGQYEVAKGRTPPGVTAASAIAYLSEENDAKISPTTTSIEEATEKVGQHILWYVHERWDDARRIKVLGQDGVFEAYEFSKADINGNTDVRVETGSAAPRSRAAKQALITELGKLGWIEPTKALKYMGMIETKQLYDEVQVDSRQVTRENERMSQMQPEVDPMSGQPMIDPGTGQPVTPQYPINEYDNDDIHIRDHENYMKRQIFETLPPEVQQIHLSHLMMHKQRSQALAMQAQMGMGGMQMPPEEGNAPPPQPGEGGEQV